MSAAAILVIYTVVATFSAGSSSTAVRDWRPIGAFESMTACKEAARLLGAPDTTRCLPGAKGTP